MEHVEKNKVLLVVPGGSLFTDPFLRSFEKLGYECAIFDYRRGMVYTNTWIKKILDRFPRLKFIKKWTVDQTNQRLLDVVQAHRPKYLFAQKGENIYPETIEKITKSGVITINFYNDMMNQYHGIARIAPAYSYFSNQCHVVLRKLWGELKLKNAYYLAHSAEPIPENKLVRGKKYNISFIGTYNTQLYPNREKYLMAIKNLGLNIWGNDAWKNTSLKDCFRGRSYGDERLDIYANSKLVVDINWDAWPSEGLSNRPFEVAGCGSLYITDGTRADIRRTYVEGKEVIIFKDENDLQEKVKYYLEHDTEREEIARAGYERTVKDHTYDARVAQIIDTLEHPEKYEPLQKA